jgi:hypothetical protein
MMTMPCPVSRPARPSRIARPAVRLHSRLRRHGKPSPTFVAVPGETRRLEFEGGKAAPFTSFLAVSCGSSGEPFRYRAYFGRGLTEEIMLAHVRSVMPTPDEGYEEVHVYEGWRLVGTRVVSR